MKIIELTLPTSAKDFKVEEKLGFAKSLVFKVSSIFSDLINNAQLVFSQALLKFKSLRKLNTSERLRQGNTGYDSTVRPDSGKSKKFLRVPKVEMPSKKVRNIFFVVLIGVALFAVGSRVVGRSEAQDTRMEVMGAKSVQELNKELTFPLRTVEGEEVSNFKFEVINAEKRDEIVVKGQRATAIKGRTFLIITLKITNNYSSPIEINTRDYIRLSINGNEDEWLAPDIHNDPVAVQAISTKFTRVGFPVNDSDSNLVLRVGEIEGEKESINLEI